MEKKFKQALKKKTPLIKRDTSQNESILEEILSISGKKTKQLKESTVEVPSADDAEVEQINTDIEKITDVPAIKIKKEPLDAMSVENEEPIDASPVKIKKEPIDASPVKIKKEPIDASPVKIKKEPIDASPVKIKKEPIDASPVKIKKEPTDASPIKIKKEPTNAASAKLKPANAPKVKKGPTKAPLAKNKKAGTVPSVAKNKKAGSVAPLAKSKKAGTVASLAKNKKVLAKNKKAGTVAAPLSKNKKVRTVAPLGKIKKEPTAASVKVEKETIKKKRQVKSAGRIKKELPIKEPKIENVPFRSLFPEEDSEENGYYIPLADRPKIDDEEVFLQNFPKGWKRKAVVRKSGKTAGQVDVYFYSPEGVKLRSRPDVAAYLARHNMNLRVEDFDFSKKIAFDVPHFGVPVVQTVNTRPPNNDTQPPNKKIKIEGKPVKVESKPVKIEKVESKPVKIEKVESKPVKVEKVESKPVKVEKVDESKAVKVEKVEPEVSDVPLAVEVKMESDDESEEDSDCFIKSESVYVKILPSKKKKLRK